MIFGLVPAASTLEGPGMWVGIEIAPCQSGNEVGNICRRLRGGEVLQGRDLLNGRNLGVSWSVEKYDANRKE